jgi:sec-independent protein translocase protein TatC
MSSLNPTEAFMLSMKLAFFAGIVLAFPLLLLFTMQFILPGLHDNEKKAIYPALAVGFILFLSGVLFAYLLVLPKVLEFFYTYGESMGIANEWRIGYYLSFATQFTLIFGLCFELPVVVWILVKIGLLNFEVMSRTRGYAIIAIVIIAAIITPTPDAFTLCLLALPMIVLYELSIWLAWFDARKVKRQEESEEKERLERLLKSPPTPKQDLVLIDDTEEGEEMDQSDSSDDEKKNE